MQPRHRVPRDLSNYIEISLRDRRTREEYWHGYYRITLHHPMAEFRRQLKQTEWYRENVQERGYTLLLVHQDVTMTKEQEAVIPLGAYTPRCATMTDPMKYFYNFRDTMVYMMWGKIDVYFRMVQRTRKPAQNSPQSSLSPSLPPPPASPPESKEKESSESNEPSPQSSPPPPSPSSPLVPREPTEELLINFEPSLYTQSLMDSHKQEAQSFLDKEPELHHPESEKREYLVI